MARLVAWIKKSITPYFNEDIKVEQLLFNLIVFMATIAGTISAISSVFVGAPIEQTIVVSFALVIMYYGLYLANAKKRYNTSSFIITFGVAIFLFPIMFITGGGVNGGMPIWFILGIIFTFAVCNGVVFWVMTILEVVIYTLILLVCYLYPESVSRLKSVKAEYLDIWQSIMIVGIIVGVMFRFQAANYQRILRKNEEQRASMEALKIEVERASNSKSDFLANMSHEIRTPMNAIIGMARIALNSEEELPEDVKQNLQDILGSGNSLLSIINDILDFSKIESGKLEIVPATFNLSTLIHDVIIVIKIKVEEKMLDLKLDIDPTIPDVLFGDEVRIKQILTNILNNAVKFTEHGSITLKANWDRIGDKARIIFSVIDTGQGIKKENLDSMFERFSRLEIRKNRSIEGTGLGLAISSQLADMMGGDIRVESEYGKGSTFIITIKLRIMDETKVYGDGSNYKEARKQSEKRKNIKFPGAKVLVVDDNQMNLRVAKGLLGPYQTELSMVDSGYAAIDACKETEYDLILLDHMMPNFDGRETLEALRKLELFHSPVIALTANAMQGVEQQYLSWGFNGYIAKPIKPEVLEATLEKFLVKYAEDESVNDDLNEDGLEKYKDTEVANIIKSDNVDKAVESVGNSKGDMVMADNIVKDAKLDEAVGLSFLGNSMEMYIEVLEIYMVESAENEEKMAEYIVDGKWKNYASVAHAIKSNSRLIGLTALGDFAYEFEMAGKNEDISFITDNQDRFIESIHYGRGLVKEYLDSKQ